MRKIGLVLGLACCMALTGCGALQTATNISNVISGILRIAQAEEPALSAKDASILTPWVNLGNTLEAELNGCIGAVPTLAKKSAFAACFNSFATGLLNPTQLSQLRILSSGSQTKVQLWATAIILGVNAALDAFGGGTQPIPTITTLPTTAQLNTVRYQLRAEGYAL